MGRFDQIYDDHREAVRAFVRRRAPESLVEDVVADTFLVCWRKLDRVPDEPLPWLYAVARKTLANQRRRLAREQRVAAGGPPLAVAEPEPVGDTVLAAAFAALSERDREVLRLIAWEGLSLSQAALEGKLGDLLGLANEVTPVPTRSVDLSKDTGLDEAMRQLAFPSKMQSLGKVNRVSFYAVRRADGDYCFAIESTIARGVGCDLNGAFPSPSRPVMVFPPLIQFAGFAADAVATVAGIDASGNTVISAPVSRNLFASATRGPFPSVVAIEALDKQGDVLATEHLPGR